MSKPLSWQVSTRIRKIGAHRGRKAGKLTLYQASESTEENKDRKT